MRFARLWAWLVCAGAIGIATAVEPPRWLTLPPTPTLPKAASTGYAPVDGIRIWYATFGHGEPVLLLHGGLANANYWGRQVLSLEDHYRVIVMDSRGHGRSTRDATPFGYDLMAGDVLGLLDYLHLSRVAIVGWSDGAIVGLDLAIHHPDRVTKLFAFAANSDPSGVKDVNRSPTFTRFIARARSEYQQLSPTPRQYEAFLAQITRMWATQPHFTSEELHGIRVPTWIVDADHDEAIERNNTLYMADHIQDSGLLILPQVSHFAFLQDPALFDAALSSFLTQVPASRQRRAPGASVGPPAER
jgi:pimeloyl-ACP methyl ester carboxylesterase